jgi:hypothetical protein
MKTAREKKCVYARCSMGGPVKLAAEGEKESDISEVGRCLAPTTPSFP